MYHQEDKSRTIVQICMIAVMFWNKGAIAEFLYIAGQSVLEFSGSESHRL